MFEQPHKRQEFLQAVKAGRINAQLLEKALASYQSFADADLNEVLQLMQLPAAKKFAAALISVNQDPEKLGKLMQMFARERRPEVEAELAAAIALCKSDAIFTEIAKMINNKDPNHRKKALKLLIKQEKGMQQRELVLALMNDPQPPIAEAMLKQVIASGAKGYQGQLRHMAVVGADSIAVLCLKALLNQPSMKNVPVFIHALATQQGEIAAALSQALGRHMQEAPEAVLEEIILAIGSSDPKVGAAALKMFVGMPDLKEATRRLLLFADSVSPLVRDDIFRLMGTVGDTFVPIVLALVQEQPEQAVRIQAMNLAKIMKNQKLGPLFLQELKNPDWMVRYSAMQVLSAMKSPQALPILVEFLNQDESSMAAIQALDRYGDMRLAKPFFQKLTTQSNESEQLALLDALLNLGDPRFIGHLSKFLDSPAVRGKAVKRCAEVIIELGKRHGVAVPEKVIALNDQLTEKKLEDLPDLGLKLSSD
ncbi:HEAT repeat domain-containing protein [Acanthopleuribacter pedis]|uniref:HEAT repeat domain-containing protein n=1 Tax=Acanthopleuribacter pedis TaxID=442870 RepID=A0A8J7U720_9BACT|nr:HEAT repeat domain-containing protein [Acanthopleuribacter pedis]MBO1322033.1 HEAT repeat domain-containing protein [Acanthopleuribacter pedis]